MPRFISLIAFDERHRLIPGFFMKKVFSRIFNINRSSPFSNKNTWSTHPVALVRAASALKASPLYSVYTDLNRYIGEITLSSLLNRCSLEGAKRGLPLGKLGFKEEAAGKLRVFAMVDPFTQ